MMIVSLIALLFLALAMLALVGYGIDAYLFAVAAQRERASRPRGAIELAIDQALESPLEYAIWSCVTIVLWVPDRLYQRWGAR